MKIQLKIYFLLLSIFVSIFLHAQTNKKQDYIKQWNELETLLLDSIPPTHINPYNRPASVKLASNYIEKLDSIIQIETNIATKTVYSYTGDRLTKVRTYTYDSLKMKWINYSRMEASFSSQGNMLWVYGCEWNTNNNQWTKCGKNIFNYDAQNRLVRRTDYVGTTINNKLLLSDRYNYYYLTNKFSVKHSKYFNAKWEERNYYINSYDSLGQLVLYEILDNDLKNGIWKNDFQQEFYYNLNGYLSESISKSWDTVNVAWRNVTKREYLFDVYGNDSIYIASITNYYQGPWIFTYKELFKYDLGGRQIEKITKDYYVGAWTNSSKEEHVYNGQGRQTRYAVYLWNSYVWSVFDYVNSWYKDSVGVRIVYSEYTYNWYGSGRNAVVDLLDTTLQSSSILKPDGYTGTYKKTSKKVYETDAAGNFGKLYFSKKFYYSGTTTSISSTADDEQSIRVYPNPATDWVIFEDLRNNSNRKLYIYNIQGSLIKAIIPNKKEMVLINDLAGGIYFYKYFSDGHEYHGKFIVE